MELPSTGENRASAGNGSTMEDIYKIGCEVQCSWRKVATDMGIDTSGFKYEQCEEVRAGLQLKGLARCGMAGIAVSLAAKDGIFS